MKTANYLCYDMGRCVCVCVCVCVVCMRMRVLNELHKPFPEDRESKLAECS